MASKPYAHDDRSQRRRELLAEDGDDQLDAKFVEGQWASEYQQATSPARTYYGRRRSAPPQDAQEPWKTEALTAIDRYPELPAPPARVEFRSVLQRDEGRFVPSVHLSDYDELVGTTTTADRWRLQDRRLERELGEYPGPRPTLPHFPKRPIEPALLPLPDKPSPPNLTVLDRLLFWIADKKREDFAGIKRRYETALSEAENRNEWLSRLCSDRRAYWQYQHLRLAETFDAVMNTWLRDKADWEARATNEKREWQRIRCAYREGVSEAAVTYYLHLCLDAVPMPRWFEHDYNLTFSPTEGILLLDLRIPDFSSMTILKDRELKSGPKEVPATIKERALLIDKLTAFLSIRFMWELEQADDDGKLKLIGCNGFVIRDDPATGLKRNDVILSVISKPDALSSLNLARLDPIACFRSLKGVSGAKMSELVPVKPLLHLDRNDSRIVASREIPTQADTNLAAMDWQDFEHLIRQLFEKEFGGEGVEVRVTQASRDRGVDAIVFDPHPIKGGKFVIQAKRYTNTVDVSAVRDLYGTVLNEGANRGIIVTTSSYGRDSFEFAKDKPLTLLSGSELLHLLNKHGYAARIDMHEARRLMREEIGGAGQRASLGPEPPIEE